MNLFTSDDVIVITGAAGGLGAAMCRRFAELGARVALTDLQSSDGAGEAESLGRDVRFFAMDVTDKADIQRAANAIEDAMGPVTGVVANAGIAPTNPTLDYTRETWDKVIAVNQTGVFLTAQVFAERMKTEDRKARAGGRNCAMVFTSSIAGLTTVHPERHIAYGASKAAVSHMAALLGVEWATRGIRVNAIAPGYIDTPILDAIKKENPDMLEEWVAAMPIKRLLQPREVADVAAFLLSDMASSITGETVACDGGYSKA